jgi:internalin A
VTLGGVVAEEGLNEAMARIEQARLDSSKMLDLNDLELGVLPEEIASLTTLVDLYLGGNGLEALPDWLSSLTNLKFLHLDRNQLTSLPNWFSSLINLNLVNLDRNQLTSLPDSLSSLTNLQVLYLNNNRLKTVPDSLGSMASLFTLRLDGNPLTDPPPEVIASGPEAVLAFLRDRSTGKAVRLWASKLLVVGEATVGKTSLAKRLTGGTFDPAEKQTHGVHIDALPLPHPTEPDAMMDLKVWDFGGQLEYRATQRFYLTDRSLFLLVWNARARWQDGKLLAWLDVITARAPESPILVVATHHDDTSAATLPEDLQQRYPRIVGIHVVDAKTGYGIDELREAIRQASAALPLMGVSWPRNWVNAAQAVRRIKGYSTSAAQVWAAMNQAGAQEPESQRAIVRALHDLGDVVYFADDRELSDKMILHPEWLDKQITAVLDSEEVATANGVMTRTERDRLWSELDPDLHDRLVRMMERFDLAYRIGDTDSSEDVALVVERLGYSRPTEVDRRWEEALSGPGTREIGFTYKLSSRQAGIPTWFIARQHRYTVGLHWAHGVLLHDHDPSHPAYALLVDDGRDQPTISLRVRGRFPVHFLSVLVEAFDNIVNQRYPGLVEAKLVSCACQEPPATPCDYAFGLDELMVELDDRDGDGKVRCPRSRRKIDARIMLDGLAGSGISRELDLIHRKIDAQADTLDRIDRRQLETLNGIRSLLAYRTQAGVHCPSLFSVTELKRSGVMRKRNLQLSLWCEWPYGPKGPHELKADQGGVYTITSLPLWLRDYLPFLHYLVATLGIAAPVISPAFAAFGKQLTDQIRGALDSADAIFDALRQIPGPGSDDAADFLAPYADLEALQRARIGADFRVLRNALTALDPQQLWGGLTPAIRPEDDGIVYLCDTHLRALDYPYKRTVPLPEVTAPTV